MGLIHDLVLRTIAELMPEEGWSDENTKDVLEVAMASSSELFFDALKDGLPEMVAEHEGMRRDFEARLALQWKEPFDLFEAVYVGSYEMGEFIHSEVSDANDGGTPVLIWTMLMLHARACRTAAEAAALLRAGFPDGVFARWRTLHEIAVACSILADHGTETAQRYLAHVDVRRYREAMEYQSHCEALGQEPIPSTDLECFRIARDEAIKAYGADFANDYGWAASITKDPKMTTLEELAGLSHMRPYHRLSSNEIHPSVKATLLNVKNFRGSRIALVGPTNHGLAEPGSAVLISLMQVNAAVCKSVVEFVPSIDVVVYERAIHSLVDQANEAFERAEQHVSDLEKDFVEAESKDQGQN